MSSSPLWGAFVPQLTLADFGPRDSNKNGFCSGAIGPNLGEIWGLAGLHFGPLFLSWPHWGDFVRHLTLADFGPRDSNKMVFVRGRSHPIWGRYGVWPVCTLAHFFSKFLPVILEFLS